MKEFLPTIMAHAVRDIYCHFGQWEYFPRKLSFICLGPGRVSSSSMANPNMGLFVYLLFLSIKVFWTLDEQRQSE